MIMRFFLLVAASGALLAAAAADYFPVQERNTWTFSYVSTGAPVVPNPPTTRDSGTVKWEIVENRNVEMVNVYTVNLTRSLVRRSMWPSDCTSVRIDSVFYPPRKTIDMVVLKERIDEAGIGFSPVSCAFAVHDPTASMPAGLSSKDTTLSFQGTAIAGKRMIVSECSCLNAKYAYSFTLGPAIGPVEAYITMCPNLAGTSYRETWKLISREYPTSSLRGNSPPAALTSVAVNQSSGRIACSLNLGYSSPVHIELLDVKGRLIKTFYKRNLNAGVHRYSWDIPTRTCGVALFRVRTGAENRCVKIMMGVE
jgi:hypothetical protein